MQIGKLLLNSQIEKLQADFTELYREVKLASEMDSAETLAAIEKKLALISKLLGEVASLSTPSSELDIQIFQVHYRNLKVAYRHIRRTWLRQQVMKARPRRSVDEKREHVTTFAA